MKQFKYMALAALVAFAACDEGSDVVVTPEVTGDVAGTVTIEGSAIAGVTVGLSTGVTTVSANDGKYLFSDVPAGVVTVKISGFPTEAAFQTTEKALEVKAGVNTADFSGTYIRTSAILGSVHASGTPLAGVKVSLNTPGILDVFTNASGNFAFTGLRAGTYEVKITGWDDARYSFSTSSVSKKVVTGETATLEFVGLTLATSTIAGTLYLDGNSNRSMDPGEPPVAKAGITVALEQAVGDTIYTTTDANGHYSFPDLAEGTYKVILLPQAAIPGAYSQTGDTRYLAVATSGAATTVNFAFEIVTQYVDVYGMLGVDEKNVGVAPIKDWSIRIYPTEFDANASTNAITAIVKTNAAGRSAFKFDREDDYSPNSASVDGIVFAKVSAPPAGYTVNGETVIEIPWLPTDSMVMAPDTFDATNALVVIGFKAEEVDLDPASGWNVALKSNKDSTSVTTDHAVTATNGMVYYTMTPATSIAAGGDGVYPDTFWVRLSTAQTANNGHAFGTTIAGDEGAKTGRYVRYIWNGTTPPSDTVMMGIETVTYKDADIIYRAHHEADDSTGVTPTYTVTDNFTEIGNVSVKILKADNTVAKAPAALTVAGAPASIGGGSDRKYNLATGQTYKAVATSAWAKLKIISADTVSFVLSGGNQIDTLDVLGGGGGPSTFAYKMDNGTINGQVLARDATPASGLKVRVMAGPGNITGTKDTTVVTDVAGMYTTLANLREGPYTISVSDSSTSAGAVWSFSETLKTTTTPIAGSGANNTNERTGVRDVHGSANVKTANFLPDRMDTKVLGVVVNDRDQDGTDLDPNEALPGAQIQLYRDNSGVAFTRDTLVGTYTTDANGAYRFSGLREGRYMVRWVAGTPADVQVLRSLTADSVIINTAATAVGLGGDNTRQVGDTIAFPRWDYSASTGFGGLEAPAHFMFLFKNTFAKGHLQDAGGVALPGVTVQLRRCNLSAGATSPPSGIAQTCGSFLAVPAVNTTSDASGNFQFSGLHEGVYEVRPLPLVGVSVPANTLYLLVGPGDIESRTFVIS